MQLNIHPDNPQPRLIQQAVKTLESGGIIIYPTNCAYVLGCHIGDKAAVERLRKIRQVDHTHLFTLMCRDLSELATYAKVDNWVFRLLKQNTPGAYTFILNASKEVPKRLLHAKRKTIGLRIPVNPIAQALLAELNEPMLSATLIPPGGKDPLSDPQEISDVFEKQVNLFINAGFGGLEATSIINLSGEKPEIIRQGQGDISPFI